MQFVMRSDMLALSECSHRTVVATVFSELPPGTDLDMIRRLFDERGIMGSIVNIKGCDFLYVFGVNEWTDESSDPLDCKGVGIPWEMGLNRLDGDGTICSRSDVDLACPKRVLEKKCDLTHAEPRALAGFLEIVDALGIGEFTKSFIVCNWVNCPTCCRFTERKCISFWAFSGCKYFRNC
ncbi:MAG: hypothetical protein U9Q67_04985 [Patescibacteria group bacterium]|nr:hypothetical protein [Patescibacteria group bacterium]